MAAEERCGDGFVKSWSVSVFFFPPNKRSLAMRPALLCRERLNRILAVLDREDGACSVRDLSRTYGIEKWEVEQAADAGWVSICQHKPRVGRSSFVAGKLSKTPSAKLPPMRYAIPHEMSIRHDRFAWESVSVVAKRNAFGFGLQSATNAYLRAFPACKSRAAAAVNASRLMKRPMIRAARLWYRKIDERSLLEPMPSTPEAIYRRLREMGEL